MTGGAGYIGAHVVLALRDSGWPVVVLDDFSTGRHLPLHATCELVEGDVGDLGLVRRILRRYDITAVIHLAGSIIAADSLRDPLRYYGNNTRASQSLLEAVVEHGLGAFIFSSTAAVYGPETRSPIDETSPPHPANAYGASKLMIERMIQDVGAAWDMPWCILRAFNTAGADPQLRAGRTGGETRHLIKAACDVALGRARSLPVFGTTHPTADGTCIRDFVHVSDLADAHLAALRHLLAGGDSDIFNCGCGHGASVLDVIRAVERVAGHEIAFETKEPRPGDAAEVVADPSRLRRLVGWQPAFDDLETIVRHALAWEHHWSARALLDPSQD